MMNSWPTSSVQYQLAQEFERKTGGLTLGVFHDDLGQGDAGDVFAAGMSTTCISFPFRTRAAMSSRLMYRLSEVSYSLRFPYFLIMTVPDFIGDRSPVAMQNFSHKYLTPSQKILT